MDRHIIDVTARFDDQLSAGAKKADDALEKLEDQAKKTEAAVKKSGKTKFDPKVSTSKVDKLMQKLNRFASKAKSGVVVTVKALDKATATLNKVNSVGAKIAGKTFTATVKIADYATRPIRGILSALTSVQALIAGVATGAAVNYGAIKPIQQFDQYKQAQLAFSKQLGSDADAQKFMNQIDAFNLQTPFNSTQIIGAAKQMLNMGWDVGDVLPDLGTIGDWAAATGTYEEGINSVIRALGQMQLKGRVYAEELQQMNEAGVAAQKYIADYLGVSEGKMLEMVEAGEVGVDQALTGIMTGMKEFDGIANEFANETVGGMLGQIGDALSSSVVRDWGEGLSEGLRPGLEYFQDLLGENQTELDQFGNALKDFGKDVATGFSNSVIGISEKLRGIITDIDFQNATIGGKINILWDEMIAQPFSEWWDASGKQMVVDAGKNFAGWLGDGIIDGIGQFAEKHPLITTLLGALGISKGVQTVKGLLNFGGGAGSGASAVGTMTVTAGVVNINGATGGIPGTSVGGMPQIPAGAGGAGTGGLAAFGSKLLTGASALATGASLLSAGMDIYEGWNTDGKQREDAYWKGGTKVAMTAGGAAIGALLGTLIPIPGLGTLAGAKIGALLGSGAALLTGDSAGQWISDQFDASRAKNSADKAAELMGLSRQGGNLEYLSNAAGLATDALAYTAPSIAKLAGNNVSSAFSDGLTGSMITAMQEAAADPSVSQSVTSMLNRLKPTTAQIESIAEGFAAAGKAVPQSITDYLANVDFYTALAGGTNEFQKYLDGFALTTDILAEIDPTVKVNPIDPSAQIRAALSGKTTTAHVGTTVIPDFLYENNELDTTQLGDGKNVISVPSVLVKPSYMYSTSGFNSALLTPNNLTVSPNVTVSAKYTVDAVSNVFKTTLGAEAAGGMVSRYGLYSLAEEGTPEMVIPLGSHRRDRGVDLWERAGHMLGVPGFFNGGIAGDEDKAVGASRYALPEMDATGDVYNSVTVSLGGVSIQVTGASGDVIEEIRARAAEAADIVAGEFVKVARARAQNSPRRA